MRAVDGRFVSIERGETFALLGESGCGKSMTALSIMRLLPDAGPIVAGAVGWRARLLAAARSRDAQRARPRIGMIFQEPDAT